MAFDLGVDPLRDVLLVIPQRVQRLLLRRVRQIARVVQQQWRSYNV